jgi:tetratricopeptide (TPR) repeat protein
MEVELTHRVPPAPSAPAAPLDAPPREVIEHLRAVLAEDPHDLEALGRLGDAQLADHDPDGALRTAATAIALAPDRELGHRHASIACSRRGRHREAIAHAEDAVRLAPAEPSAFLALARALLRAKRDLERARRAAVRAMVIAPEASEPHLVFGMVAAAEGEQAAAEAAFRRAVQLHPGNMAARNELARLELRRAVQRGIGRPVGPVSTMSEAGQTGPSIGSSRRRVDEMKRALHVRLRARRATAPPVVR